MPALAMVVLAALNGAPLLDRIAGDGTGLDSLKLPSGVQASLKENEPGYEGALTFTVAGPAWVPLLRVEESRLDGGGLLFRIRFNAADLPNQVHPELRVSAPGLLDRFIAPDDSDPLQVDIPDVWREAEVVYRPVRSEQADAVTAGLRVEAPGTFQVSFAYVERLSPQWAWVASYWSGAAVLLLLTGAYAFAVRRRLRARRGRAGTVAGYVALRLFYLALLIFGMPLHLLFPTGTAVPPFVTTGVVGLILLQFAAEDVRRAYPGPLFNGVMGILLAGRRAESE